MTNKGEDKSAVVFVTEGPAPPSSEQGLGGAQHVDRTLREDEASHQDLPLATRLRRQEALRNFEDFYNIPRGTATLDQVCQSSAGVAGWTDAGAAEPAGQPKRGHSATGSSVPAKRARGSLAAAAVAAPAVVTEPEYLPSAAPSSGSGSGSAPKNKAKKGDKKSKSLRRL